MGLPKRCSTGRRRCMGVAELEGCRCVTVSHGLGNMGRVVWVGGVYRRVEKGA